MRPLDRQFSSFLVDTKPGSLSKAWLLGCRSFLVG